MQAKLSGIAHELSGRFKPSIAAFHPRQGAFNSANGDKH
jgi:hypothetical protein